MKRNIKSMTLAELEAQTASMGLPSYRAGQIYRWLHRGCTCFDAMSNLPGGLRETLDREFFITAPSILQKQVSAADGTIKYLWELYDGNSVESVLMEYRHGNSICVSTQVGCRMGCRFCASTIGGLVRSLEPSEILDQVLFAQLDSGKKISNIVLMGIGEPLDNFDSVLRFLELVNSPEGLNIGMRHISLSTCGLVEEVDKLADYNLQLTLSVSLHAPDNETRSKLMPVNRRYDVDTLLSACERYFRKTGRRVSFEYSMIRDVNDTDEHARLLSRKLAGTGSHVNLIRLNHVDERGLEPSTNERVKAFMDILGRSGINVTLRRRLGSVIDASCGQLRRKQQRNRGVL